MTGITAPGTPAPAHNPDIDVVIATYNAPPQRLARTIASARTSGRVASIIVVDDGSVPPTQGLAPDPRLVLVRQENAGPAAARNAGIERTTAPLVAFIDDDDELLPEGLEALADLVLRLGAGGGVAARIHTWADGREEPRDVPAEWRDSLLPHPSHVLRPIGLFGASGCMVARAVLDRGVRFDSDLRLGEDRDFLTRVAAAGGLAISSAPALRVAMHEGGTNLSSPAHYSRRIRDHLIVLDRYPDAIAQGHLKDATRWLINASAKAGVDRESWRKLASAAAARGWAIPLKARFRRLLRPGPAAPPARS